VKFPFLRTIRTHLLLLVLICILPALGIIIYSGLNRSYREIERAKSDALQVVKNFSFDHERAVESARQFLMTLAKVPDIQNLNVTQSNKLLGELLTQNPLYSTLFVVNAQGFVHASGRPLPPAPVSVMQRKYFQDMVRLKDFSVGEYAICPAVKRPVLHFAYPIFDTGGQFKGMVALSLDLTRYAKMFPMDQLPQDSTLSFSDHKGIFLYRYPGEEDNIPKPDLPDMIRNMSSQKEGVFTYTGVDGLIRLYAYKNFRIKPNEPAYLFMRVGIPEKKALLHARKALSINLVLLGIAFIGALFSAWFLGNAIIFRRLNKLVEASRRLGHGDLKTRTGLNHKSDELGELGKAFDEMAGALEKKYIEHEQAERKSKKIADEWQTTFDSITDLVMILDNEFRMVRVNEATLRFFNLPMDRILGNSCFPLVYGMNEPPEPNPFTEMKRTRKHEETELYLAEKGIWFFVSADPILDGEGNIIGLVHIVKDITDRKQAEEALRESEKKFKDLVEKSNVGVYLIQDRVNRYVNARCAEILGYSVEEVIDKIGPKDTTFPEDWSPLEENIQKRTSGEVKFIHREFRIITKNKEIKNVEVFGSRTIYQGKPAVVGTMLDITERKRAEEALKEKTEELARSNKDLEQFAYVASHDLQEPLRMVTNYLQLLARRYQGKLDSDADEFIGFAVDGATHMWKLINDLLTYSRVGMRGKELEPTDCETVLNQSLNNLEMAIEEKGAIVTHDPLPTVIADNPQLELLFQNLIGNAIKFQGNEPPRIHVSASRNGSGWIFSVRDNGIGIAPEYAERIFIIFQRLHSRKEFPGTGIGLAICKKIVERHGGHIWVESEFGKGATFYFTLPASKGKLLSHGVSKDDRIEING